VSKTLGISAGIVAGAGHVAQAEVVRLALVVAAELEEEEADPLAGEAGVGPEVLAGDRGDAEAELGELGCGSSARPSGGR
jgi:hypothetical protein